MPLIQLTLIQFKTGKQHVLTIFVTEQMCVWLVLRMAEETT